MACRRDQVKNGVNSILELGMCRERQRQLEHAMGVGMWPDRGLAGGVLIGKVRQPICAGHPTTEDIVLIFGLPNQAAVLIWIQPMKWFVSQPSCDFSQVVGAVHASWCSPSQLKWKNVNLKLMSKSFWTVYEKVLAAGNKFLQSLLNEVTDVCEVITIRWLLNEQ